MIHREKSIHYINVDRRSNIFKNKMN
jgi:hypothetical protein